MTIGAVGVALTLLGALWWLLWETDGSLDWVPAGAGLAMLLLWLMMMEWDRAIADAESAALRVGIAHAVALRAALDAKLWPTALETVVFVAGWVSISLPWIVRFARRARRKP